MFPVAPAPEGGFFSNGPPGKPLQKGLLPFKLVPQGMSVLSRMWFRKGRETAYWGIYQCVFYTVRSLACFPRKRAFYSSRELRP